MYTDVSLSEARHTEYGGLKKRPSLMMTTYLKQPSVEM